jgi:hypothetical protein
MSHREAVDAVVRSLTREYRISTRSPELAGLLAFIGARPDMIGPALTRIEIFAHPSPDGFRLSVPGGEAFA